MIGPADLEAWYDDADTATTPEKSSSTARPTSPLSLSVIRPIGTRAWVRGCAALMEHQRRWSGSRS